LRRRCFGHAQQALAVVRHGNAALTPQSFVTGESLQLAQLPFEDVDDGIDEERRLEELVQIHELRVLLAVVLSLVTDRHSQILRAEHSAEGTTM
jgi:hypothetical protein